MKQLSRSVLLMFIFDLSVFAVSTVYWYSYFNLPTYLKELAVALILATGIFSLYLKDNYKIREFNITGKNTYLLFEGVFFAHIPAAILFLFANNFQTGLFITVNILTIFAILRLYRALFHIYLFKLKKAKNILILGTGKDAKLIADEIINKRALKMNVVGFYEDSEDENVALADNTKIFKNSEDLSQIIKDNNIDIVIVAIKRRMENEFLSKMIFSLPRDVKLFKMAEFYEMVTGKYYIDRMTINWLFYDFMNNRSLIYDFCKRAFDIIAASIILTVTFPITGFTALRIWLTDGENPIYTQTRIGKGGKPFKCYKLRTMYANNYVPKSLKNGGYAENQEVDDRVIPWCKFVRKARFDEIPQMINILKGEMSIVGPRAEWEEVVNIYKEQIPYYNCRMWVKTGWTGWAQINQGHLFSVDDEVGKLVYDLYYIKHRNVLWEICILVKAVFLALGGRHD